MNLDSTTVIEVYREEIARLQNEVILLKAIIKQNEKNATKGDGE